MSYPLSLAVIAIVSLAWMMFISPGPEAALAGAIVAAVPGFLVATVQRAVIKKTPSFRYLGAVIFTVLAAGLMTIGHYGG